MLLGIAYNASNCSEIAVEWKRDVGEEEVMFNDVVHKRRKVVVGLKFRNVDIAAYMLHKLKDGSKQVDTGIIPPCQRLK